MPVGQKKDGWEQSNQLCVSVWHTVWLQLHRMHVGRKIPYGYPHLLGTVDWKTEEFDPRETNVGLARCLSEQG